jgi:predicted RNA-binding Zn ribbon-like protein
MLFVQTLQDLPFVAGDPALDFVNTGEERGHPLAGDVLHGPEDLREWGCRYGLLSTAATSARPAQEFSKALEARELLYRLCFSRVHGETDDPGDVRRLAELAAEAYAAGSLAPTGAHRLEWHWRASDLATVRHVATTSAVELLAGAATSRLKQCPGDHCGWFFLDATKRGNRRWCQMSGCGQLAKSARRRQRSATPDTARGL